VCVCVCVCVRAYVCVVILGPRSAKFRLTTSWRSS